MSETVVESGENRSPTSIVTIFKDNWKFILSVITVGLVSSLINSYYLSVDHLFGVVIKFRDNADEEWVNELRTNIIGKYDTPNNKWETYTQKVARCYAMCNEASDNISIFFDVQCQTQPVYILDREVTPELLSSMTYAEATLPCFLKIAQSTIPRASLGVFTTKYKIPKGFIFDPYGGPHVKFNAEEAKKIDNRYSWMVRPDKSEPFIVDAGHAHNSNWLRYVNSARYREEQNMFPLLFNNNVYYMTINDVEPNTELLVWYGYKYAKSLNIFLVSTSRHERTSSFAPPVAEVICPTCPIIEGQVLDYDLIGIVKDL